MEQIILFAFLTLFPFGQIIKIGIINPLDVVVGIAAVYAISKRLPRPKYFKYLENFLVVLFFTWLVSALYLWDAKVFYGLLYLVRLASYFYFSVVVFNFKNKELLLNSLLYVSIFAAIFGWMQYFLYPDLTTFTIWGWDDHLYRMTGTFLDPGFLGIILVLGSLLAFHKKNYLIAVFLALSVLFTYSRASYLALLVSSLFVFKKTTYYLGFAACILIIVIFLPKKTGEGVRLERTASVHNRLENYTQTLEVFRKSPLFGVGFNNICLVKNSDFSSHSCSGADSSLLFLLATAGVIGFMSFGSLVFNILQVNNQLLKVGFLATMVHALFSNSLFYPWVMGWLVILLGSEKDD